MQLLSPVGDCLFRCLLGGFTRRTALERLSAKEAAAYGIWALASEHSHRYGVVDMPCQKLSAAVLRLAAPTACSHWHQSGLPSHLCVLLLYLYPASHPQMLCPLASDCTSMWVQQHECSAQALRTPSGLVGHVVQHDKQQSCSCLK